MKQVCYLIIVFIFFMGCDALEQENLQSPAQGEIVETTDSNQYIINSPSLESNAKFGSGLYELANGNIVIKSGDYTSDFDHYGEIHLFSPTNKTIISSYYGDDAGDLLGANIYVLNNGNFIISSPRDLNYFFLSTSQNRKLLMYHFTQI